MASIVGGNEARCTIKEKVDPGPFLKKAVVSPKETCDPLTISLNNCDNYYGVKSCELKHANRTLLENIIVKRIFTFDEGKKTDLPKKIF